MSIDASIEYQSGTPLKAEQVFGVWGTVLLPIEADESIAFDRLDEAVDHLLTSGVHGVYTNGTAGEFFTQSEAEFDTISNLVASRCHAAGVPVQIGVSHPCPDVTLSRLVRACELSPGAMQFILPDWSPVTLDEAIRFCERLAREAAGIPLVLYNPPHAKRVLSPRELGELVAAVPAIVGLKVCGGDAAWYEQMRENVPGVSLFIAGHRMVSGMQHGAHGSYSNMACLNPSAAVRWYEQAIATPEAALDVETRINTFFAAHLTPYLAEQGYANHAADKLLAAMGGWANLGTRVRWPYRSFDQQVVDRLKAEARQAIPEFF